MTLMGGIKQKDKYYEGDEINENNKNRAKKTLTRQSRKKKTESRERDDVSCQVRIEFGGD